MRAGAEYDEAQVAHVHDQHALVHQVGIGPPFLRIVAPAKMVLATGLERRHPRDLAAVVEVAVEQGARSAVVDDARTARLHFRRRGHALGGADRAILQEHAALVEHVGIDVDRRAAAASAGVDGVERRRQCPHVIPMAMRHGDFLDLAEIDAEVAAVPEEDGAFGAGVEQQDMLGRAETGFQAQAVAEIGDQQCLARDFPGARQHDIGEFRYGKGGFARVGVTDVVGDDLDRELVDRGERGNHDDFRNFSSSRFTSAACSCCTQWPAPSRRWISFMFVQLLFCILSMAPGAWWMPQSLRPAMKVAGTSIVRPAKTSSSPLKRPPVRTRYQLSPPWKPVRPYSLL